MRQITYGLGSCPGSIFIFIKAIVTPAAIRYNEGIDERKKVEIIND